jgi:predicted PurR-regulated permease PerM
MGVHFMEGHSITPLVQAEASELAPVLALLNTVGFSVLFGPSSFSGPGKVWSMRHE